MAKLILHKSAPVGLGSPKYLENSATELVTSRKTRELVTVRLREVTNSVALFLRTFWAPLASRS